jgi:peroxiredoxin
MLFCPYCGSGCDTMSGLSRHLSQRASSCAFALSKDPKHSKKRAASAKTQSFKYDVGDKHNLNIAYLGDDDDQVLLSLSNNKKRRRILRI